jgi:hypothetical protein
MASVLKNPPAFDDKTSYDNWKKDIVIRRQLTDIGKENQALVIHLSLTGKARQVSSQLGVEVLNKDNGVDKLISKLDEIFLPDKSRRQFKVFQDLYNLKRPSDVSVGDFLNEFERVYFCFTQEAMTLPDAVMAFMLLTSCSLTESQFQMVMSSIPEVTFASMKASLRRIFGGELGVKQDLFSDIEIKREPVFYTGGDSTVSDKGFSGGEREEVFFGNRGGNYRYSGRPRSSMRSRGGNVRGSRGRFMPRSGTYQGGNNRNRQLNPLGRDGQPSKCVVCDSVYHWARNCPHAHENNEDYRYKNGEEFSQEKEEFVQLSLLTGYTDDRDQTRKLGNLLNESYGKAILDTGCSTTVCGEKWLNNYIGSLSDYDRSMITQEATSSTFTFGDGRSVSSLKRVVIPCHIAAKRATIRTDVVACDIPLLLSRSSMKQARMSIHFEKDVAVIAGVSVKLNSTTSGHYSLDLSL